jgi:cytochrome b561
MNNVSLVKYPLSMRIYHWIVVLMVASLIYVGYYMSDLEVSDEKWKLYFMHKSFGTLFLIIMLARIYNRMRSKVPALPSNVNIFDAKISKIVHYLLYIILLIMPISGMLMSIFGGRGLPFFFTTFLTDLSRHEEISGAFWLIHTKLPSIILILVSLHIIGSIKHLIIDKVNIIKRII